MKKFLSFLLFLTPLMYTPVHAFTGWRVKLIKEITEVSQGAQGWYEEAPHETIAYSQSKSKAFDVVANVNTNATLHGFHHVDVINETNHSISFQYQFMLLCQGHFIRKVDWYNVGPGGKLSDDGYTYLVLLGRKKGQYPIQVITQLFVDGGVTDIAKALFRVV